MSYGDHFWRRIGQTLDFHPCVRCGAPYGPNTGPCKPSTVPNMVDQLTAAIQSITSVVIFRPHLDEDKILEVKPGILTQRVTYIISPIHRALIEQAIADGTLRAEIQP